MTNWALWKKAVSDVWLLLILCAGLLVLFAWAFVWFTSLFQLGAFAGLINALPAPIQSFIQSLIGLPLAKVVSPEGQITMAYLHLIPLVICVGWAVGRGSDPIAGEIGRGTMDLLLTLPVRRVAVLAIPAIVSTLGTIVLAAAMLLGTWLGISTVKLSVAVRLEPFVPGAVNIGCLVFCLTGLTALASSWDHNRWRSMSLAVGVFLVSALIKMVARVWQAGWWLKYLTFLTAFEPQRLILMPEGQAVAWRYHGTLVGIGLFSYALAAVIFSLRDIPQPR